MNEAIQYTTITKKDFEVWVNGSLNDFLWEEMKQHCLKEVESFIDYITETLVDDYKNKIGIFTRKEGEQQ